MAHTVQQQLTRDQKEKEIDMMKETYEVRKRLMGTSKKTYEVAIENYQIWKKANDIQGIKY